MRVDTIRNVGHIVEQGEQRPGAQAFTFTARAYYRFPSLVSRGDRGVTVSDSSKLLTMRRWRDTVAFERLTVRMLFLIGVGTAANLGYLMHLKSQGDFGDFCPL